MKNAIWILGLLTMGCATGLDVSEFSVTDESGGHIVCIDESADADLDGALTVELEEEGCGSMRLEGGIVTVVYEGEIYTDNAAVVDVIEEDEGTFVLVSGIRATSAGGATLRGRMTALTR